MFHWGDGNNWIWIVLVVILFLCFCNDSHEDCGCHENKGC